VEKRQRQCTYGTPATDTSAGVSRYYGRRSTWVPSLPYGKLLASWDLVPCMLTNPVVSWPHRLLSYKSNHLRPLSPRQNPAIWLRCEVTLVEDLSGDYSMLTPLFTSLIRIYAVSRSRGATTNYVIDAKTGKRC